MENKIKKIKRNNIYRIIIVTIALLFLIISTEIYRTNPENAFLLGISLIIFLTTTPLIFITIISYKKITKLNKELNQTKEKEKSTKKNENYLKQFCEFCGCLIKEDTCKYCGAKKTIKITEKTK